MTETITDRYPHLTSCLLIGSEGAMRLAIRNEDLAKPGFARDLARVNEGRPGVGHGVSLMRVDEAADSIVSQSDEKGWEDAMVVHFIDRDEEI